MKKGILVHESNDDVGVAVMDLMRGEEIHVVTLEGEDVKKVSLVTDVPLGHKVALHPMNVDQHVMEYGRAIGYVFAPIQVGEHVHIHNMKSLRWAASTSQVLGK